MTSGLVERHSPEVWRKTAVSLQSSYAGASGADGPDTAAPDAAAEVNVNGAPLLGDTRDLFRPKTSDIPAKPGVYKWRDGEGRVIYVGKAKNLRNRLSNYFQPLYLLHPRTQTMVLTARSLEWTVVGTELESLTLEYTWIKEFEPRFNIKLRDDKTYPYLAVSIGEQVPRVWVTRSRPLRQGVGYAQKPGPAAQGVPGAHLFAERVPQGAADEPPLSAGVDRQMLRSLRRPYQPEGASAHV